MSSDNVFVLNTTGHIALARSIINQDIWLAWGNLIPIISDVSGISGSQSTVNNGSLPAGNLDYTVTGVNDFGETAGSDIITVAVVAPNNAVQLTWPTLHGLNYYNIYRRDPSDQQLKLIGRTTDATVGSFTDTGLPLGTQIVPTTNTTSVAPWTDNPPSANINHTKLYNEVGRRKAVIKNYVVPDVNGSISTTAGNWSVSNTPTKWVYLQVGFRLQDAVNMTLYQLGVFVGTIPKSGNENLTYLTPDQISDPGTLFSLSNVTPIYRNASTREIRELVITF